MSQRPREPQAEPSVTGFRDDLAGALQAASERTLRRCAKRGAAASDYRRVADTLIRCEQNVECLRSDISSITQVALEAWRRRISINLDGLAGTVLQSCPDDMGETEGLRLAFALAEYAADDAALDDTSTGVLRISLDILAAAERRVDLKEVSE
jgi:hypothetical protein